MLGRGIPRYFVKQDRGVLPNHRVGGKNPHIRIEPRRIVVIIPRPHMDVPAEPGALLPHHQGDLGMGLQAN
ncbi:hypothetical protein D3C73_1374230 [compost metagenome]